MSTQKTMQRKGSTLLATGTAALIALTGALVAPTAAYAADGPSITVTPSTNINGENIVTVTGEGYNPDQAIYVTTCTDVDLAEVDFSFISAGCTDGAQLVWNQDAVDKEGAPRALQFDANGGFSVEMPAVEREGSTAFYTIANHTAMGDRSQDAKASILFGEDVALNASVSDAKQGTLSVSVGLENIQLLPSDAGVYAALIEKGTEAQLDQANLGAAADFIMRKDIAEGKADRLLAAEAGNLDRTKQYEVLVWRAHGLATPDRIVARADVAVTDAQWDQVFKKDEPKPEPEKPVTIPFTDMKKGDKFYTEIAWMYTQGISTGTKQNDGSVKYLPRDSVTREAMAAFLYRHYGDKNYKAPASVKFTDVKKGDKFFKEIAWMAEKGISTGTKQADGSVKFEPMSEISREAMAAFLYRADDSKKPKPLTTSPFADMKKGDKFYKEILWMSQAKISTGNKNGNNKPNYLPKDDVTREAMAAFIYRAAK